MRNVKELREKKIAIGWGKHGAANVLNEERLAITYVDLTVSMKFHEVNSEIRKIMWKMVGGTRVRYQVKSQDKGVGWWWGTEVKFAKERGGRRGLKTIVEMEVKIYGCMTGFYTNLTGGAVGWARRSGLMTMTMATTLTSSSTTFVTTFITGETSNSSGWFCCEICREFSRSRKAMVLERVESHGKVNGYTPGVGWRDRHTVIEVTTNS